MDHSSLRESQEVEDNFFDFKASAESSFLEIFMNGNPILLMLFNQLKKGLSFF
jgi:hypothetical protein